MNETLQSSFDVRYDQLADCYHTRLPNGKELGCDCPVTLAEVLHSLDERTERRAETRAIVVSLLVGATMFALAALLGSWLG